ncbi:betaine-aldehyde dehydrogenase [Hellea sp.]|nr:betaine-aldehyde dehydrogenase [Hellea sp.]
MLDLKTGNFINGELVDGDTEKLLVSINPATGSQLTEIKLASLQQANHTVEIAKKNQKKWAELSGKERGRILHKTAELIRQNRDRLAKLETLDAGKPISETPEADIDSAADCFEYFSAIAHTMQSEHIPVDGGFAYTTLDPLGVVLAIGAWNYPFQIASWKTAPALACGNSVIFKPSELTPITASELAKILKKAGLPDGVFNVLNVETKTIVNLCAHKDIAKVSITGSVETGKKVMSQSASTLKHITMELGGKSPLIIFKDADMDIAVQSAINANFYTQGEICTNGTRVFVERPVYENFLSVIKNATEALKVGDPLDPETDIGSLISKQHMQKVLSYIKSGIDEGAKIIAGGLQVTKGNLKNGNFIQPTIFSDVKDNMKIAREEIFGPVMCVMPFDTEIEVIERANNTELGLAAGVITKNLSKGHRVAKALEAGICWVNSYNLTPVNIPFGGKKMSGLGRENGWAAVENYTERKTIFVAIEQE